MKPPSCLRVVTLMPTILAASKAHLRSTEVPTVKFFPLLRLRMRWVTCVLDNSGFLSMPAL